MPKIVAFRIWDGPGLSFGRRSIPLPWLMYFVVFRRFAGKYLVKILSAFNYSRLCGGICGVSCSNLSRGTCSLDQEFLFSSLYHLLVCVLFIIIFQSDLAQIKCVWDVRFTVQKQRPHGTGDVLASDNMKTFLSRPVCSSNTVAK